MTFPILGLHSAQILLTEISRVRNERRHCGKDRKKMKQDFCSLPRVKITCTSKALYIKQQLNSYVLLLLIWVSCISTLLEEDELVFIN